MVLVLVKGRSNQKRPCHIIKKKTLKIRHRLIARSWVWNGKLEAGGADRGTLWVSLQLSAIRGAPPFLSDQEQLKMKACDSLQGNLECSVSAIKGMRPITKA